MTAASKAASLPVEPGNTGGADVQLTAQGSNDQHQGIDMASAAQMHGNVAVKLPGMFAKIVDT